MARELFAAAVALAEVAWAAAVVKVGSFLYPFHSPGTDHSSEQSNLGHTNAEADIQLECTTAC